MLRLLFRAQIAIAGRLPWLWTGAALLGIAYAGGSVGWHLGTHHFAPRGRTLQFMGLHVSLSGARGLLAPLAGITLYEIIEASAPGHGAWAMIVPVMLCSLGAAGFAQMAAAEDRAGTLEPQAQPVAAVAGAGPWRRSRAIALRTAIVAVLLGSAARGISAPETTEVEPVIRPAADSGPLSLLGEEAAALFGGEGVLRDHVCHASRDALSFRDGDLVPVP